MFDFYQQVIKPRNISERFRQIELLRTDLLKDRTEIAVADPGSGSRSNPSPIRKIRDIARSSLSPAVYSRIYARIAEHYNCRNVIELGTSFGINSLYLAHGRAWVNTFEGAPEIASIARRTFDRAKATNITLIEGDIGRTLSPHLERNPKTDLVFMDANHRYEPTMAYFKQLRSTFHKGTIVIVDDIYLHREMEQAWVMLKNDDIVYGSIDLFRCGILFFDPSLNKQHVVLQL